MYRCRCDASPSRFASSGRASRRAAERALLIALGVAAGAAVLAAVLGGRLVMQDRSLALATAQLQPADREVQVDLERRASTASRG